MFGGGIANDSSGGGLALLAVQSCTIRGNSAFGGGGLENNGRFGNAMLIIATSAIAGNMATNFGGGVLNNGSEAGGSAIMGIAASTIVGNLSTGGSSGGGGIANLGESAGYANLQIGSCTFSDNSGAFLNDGQFGGNASVNIGNTIIKTGSLGTNILNQEGTITSAGYNLSNDSAGGDASVGPGGWLNGTADRRNTDPLLDPAGLKDNGGPTPTIALQATSPAIDQGKRDAGPYLIALIDQRGRPRPFDFPGTTNATGGDGSDIGAFELGPPPLKIASSATNVVLTWFTNDSGYALEWTTTLSDANSWTLAPGAPAIVGNEYVVTNGPISGKKFYRLIKSCGSGGPGTLDQQQTIGSSFAGSLDQWQSFTAGQSSLKMLYTTLDRA